MTKFARLRVDVPVDDGLTVGQVREHMRAFLEERGTESLELAHIDSTDETTLPGNGLPRLGRIHWPAVDVVLHTERAQPAPPMKAAAKPPRRAAAGEGSVR